MIGYQLMYSEYNPVYANRRAEILKIKLDQPIHVLAIISDKLSWFSVQPEQKHLVVLNVKKELF